MVSSVTEGHIKKLRKAGYLSNDIAHRLPEKGQLIPTPRPHERVVFLPHFLHGLGFPLHPFCNAPDTPAGGRYSWQDLDWPHKSILVFSVHLVLTRAHPGATSRLVTHPDTTPS